MASVHPFFCRIGGLVTIALCVVGIAFASGAAAFAILYLSHHDVGIIPEDIYWWIFMAWGTAQAAIVTHLLNRYLRVRYTVSRCNHLLATFSNSHLSEALQLIKTHDEQKYRRHSLPAYIIINVPSIIGLNIIGANLDVHLGGMTAAIYGLVMILAVQLFAAMAINSRYGAVKELKGLANMYVDS